MLNIFTPTTSSCFYGFEKAQNHIQLKCFNMMLNHLIIVSIIEHVHVQDQTFNMYGLQVSDSYF